MERVTFVTGNVNKGHEIKERFNREQIPIEIVQMDFQEPEVNDIEEVSKSKAMQAYQRLQRPCFVIDSGFNIKNYPNNPGYPGAFVRRSGISENIDGLLDTLKEVKDRSCQFLDCLTFYDGKEFYCFYGKDEGSITYEKRGKENKAMRSPLWYVFQPKDSTKTLAEMTDEERISRKDGHISAKEQFIKWYKEKEKKDALRNKLFDKYFEVKEGVSALDMIKKLDCVTQVWKQLRKMCQDNVEYFDAYSTLESCKMITHKKKLYLILKTRIFNYIIISLSTMENIEEKTFKEEFDEEFFVNNFRERPTNNKRGFPSLYDVLPYTGDIQTLYDFYLENRDILSIESSLFYKIREGSAWTYFSIDFANASAQVGFQTPNQFLYEHLFLGENLTPSGMQDAQSKIGVERMQEMFDKIKEIKLPESCIPKNLYELYKKECAKAIVLNKSKKE